MNRIDQYLDEKENRQTIYRFAYLGELGKWCGKLRELADLAEPEIWSTGAPDSYDVLHNYLVNTFDKAYQDNLVELSEQDEYASYNTGLMTVNGEDIICLFNRFDSSKKYSFHIHGFYKISDRIIMKHFDKTPSVVSYFDDPAKAYFNPHLEVVPNIDHIIDENSDRFPKHLQVKGKDFILSLMTHATDLALKRCKRNHRIAVPQYYRGKITYLLPINLDGYIVALALEEINNRYRANTVLTIEMAYNNARLIMKPESNWLDISKLIGDCQASD